MRDYKVKKIVLEDGAVCVTFKRDRKLASRITRFNDGETLCEYSFAGCSCLASKYANWREAVARTLDYLEGICFDGKCTFNGKEDASFIYNI